MGKGGSEYITVEAIKIAQVPVRSRYRFTSERVGNMVVNSCFIFGNKFIISHSAASWRSKLLVVLKVLFLSHHAHRRWELLCFAHELQSTFKYDDGARTLTHVVKLKRFNGWSPWLLFQLKKCSFSIWSHQHLSPSTGLGSAAANFQNQI